MNLNNIDDHGYFKDMVDQMVSFAEYDEELNAAIKWIDSESKKRGITFYDMVFEKLIENEARKKAEKWLNKKNGKTL